MSQGAEGLEWVRRADDCGFPRMTARFQDAVAGWDVYRRLHGEVTLPELNEALQSRGFRRVAPRTFTHYQKLARLGYKEYVSINRLDLRHATSSVFDANDRSRYSDRSLDTPAKLAVPGLTDVDWFDGRVTRISESYASFVTVSSPPALRVGRAQKYNRGVLVLSRVGVERAVEVRECVELDGLVELVLVFRSLLETDLVFPELVGPTSVGRFRVPLGNDPSLYSVMTIFHRSFDLYESSRGIADLYASAALPDRRPLFASPRVRRLKVDSPFELDVVGSPLVWVVVAATFRAVAPIVVGAVRDIQEGIHASTAEARRKERHPAELEALQLENLKRRIEIIQLVEGLDPAMREQFGAATRRDGSEPNAERLEALKNQAVEAAAEIVLEATEPVELSLLEEVEDVD